VCDLFGADFREAFPWLWEAEERRLNHDSRAWILSRILRVWTAGSGIGSPDHEPQTEAFFAQLVC
jgi:hypothetical protein